MKKVSRDQNKKHRRWAIGTLFLTLLLFADLPGGAFAKTGRPGFEPLSATRSFSAYAPSERVRFDHLTIEDGLSQNTVRAILQDRLGLMWFGTDEGLNRFDGYTFTVFQHDPDRPETLGGSSVFGLCEDRRGQLWIGTDQGLDRFDRTSQTFTHYSGSGAEPFGPVQALIEEPGPGGKLWIGTASHGLYRMDTATGSFLHYRHQAGDPGSLANDSVYALLQIENGDLWVATDGGLDRYLLREGRFQHYQNDIARPDSPSGNRVRALFADSKGMLWIGTEDSGLNRLDPGTGRFTFYMHSSADSNSLSDDRVLALFEDMQGGMWVGTRMGLNRFDRQRNAFTRFLPDSSDPESFSGGPVLSLYAGSGGVVWIGTEAAGISQYKPGAHKFRQYLNPDLPPGEMDRLAVQALLEDTAGRLWIGAMQTGLLQFDRANGAWKTYRHNLEDPRSLASDAVSALAQDPQGNLWVGMLGGGLDRFDPSTGGFIHYRRGAATPGQLSSNTVSVLLVGLDGSLWVGTLDAGLNRLIPGRAEFQQYRHNPEDPTTISSDRVLSLYQDSGGNVWVGTYDEGLNRFDPKTGSFQRFKHIPGNPDSLSHNQVLSLQEDRQGNLWVGTKEGLNRFDPSNTTFRHYLARDGLPSNTINCMQPDSAGRLWIGTVNGLSRFDTQREAFQTYTIEDGLQSREFIHGACYQSRRGELFFGGVQGLNAFFPEDLEGTVPPPPVIISSSMKQGQMVLRDLTGGEEIRLSYQDSPVTFEFAALEYNAPERIRYAYRLEGFDAAWIDSGEQRFARYANLRSGRYTFRVRAQNSAGTWDETRAAVFLTILPPVWETAWFRTVAGILVVALVYGGYRLRVRNIQRRNKLLEQKVAELSHQVKEAAIAAERSRVARDLHDSVTQSLYSLALMAEAGLRTLEAGRPVESREHMARVGQIAQRALQEMRLMVFALRQPALEKEGLVGALAYRLEAVERRSGMEARLTVQDGITLSPQMEAELYFLAQEALNNTLKHAGADTVILELSTVDGQVVMEIQDNGRGFDLAGAARSGGYGLVSMRERAEKMGGRIMIASTPGSGTEIRVELPIEKPVSLKDGRQE